MSDGFPQPPKTICTPEKCSETCKSFEGYRFVNVDKFIATFQSPSGATYHLDRGAVRFICRLARQCEGLL